MQYFLKLYLSHFLLISKLIYQQYSFLHTEWVSIHSLHVTDEDNLLSS